MNQKHIENLNGIKRQLDENNRFLHRNFPQFFKTKKISIPVVKEAEIITKKLKVRPETSSGTEMTAYPVPPVVPPAKKPTIRYSLAANTFDSMSYFVKQNLEPEPFSKKLSEKIASKGFEKDSDFYRRCGISRQHFSKIMSDSDYTPGKGTMLAMAFVLKLSLNEAYTFLSYMGYTFKESDPADIAAKYCFLNKIYDIDDINEALYMMDAEPLIR